MSHDIDNHLSDSALPSDVTLRAPAYRRKGIIAALVAAGAALLANRKLRRASHRYRSGRAPPVPDWLREDVGLPPLPRKFPDWWERLPPR
jgi:hypothetical protein